MIKIKNNKDWPEIRNDKKLRKRKSKITRVATRK